MCGSTGEKQGRSRLRLRPGQRLRRRDDIRRALGSGGVASCAYLVVHVGRNRLPWTRLAISASRRVGTAVVRNRLRRLVREAFRLTQHELPPGLDVVYIVRPRPDAKLGDYLEVLPRLVRRAVEKLDSRRRTR